MCEFCHKHGEGKKWYLEAKNYSEDLLSDLKRRKFISGFFADRGGLADEGSQLANLDKAPAFVRSVIQPRIIGRQKKAHYGQVLPLEDVEKIFGFVNSVTRLPCVCRHVRLGTEQRFCYGISMGTQGGEFNKILGTVDASYWLGPDLSKLEAISKDQALENFRQYEKEGLCHSVWTFMTPFIGGLCNCDRSDCGALQATVVHNFPVMFRAEYVAEADPELCNGCRSCMRVCQFGAIGYSAANKKAYIDQGRCYGCGICRSNCAKGALKLRDRSAVAAVANRW